MKPVVFVGSNANILQMVDNAHSTGREVAGIIDADYYGHNDSIDGIPVIGEEYTFDFSDDYEYFLATSWFPERTEIQLRNRNKRKRLIELINYLPCTSLIHARAWVPETCKIGKSVMIGADAILGNYSCVGDFAQIREQAYLAHHANVGAESCVQVGCYVGAEVELGAESYMGIHAKIVPAQNDPVIIPRGTFIKSNQMVTKSLTNS